jgi:hypothetical protein
MGSQLHRRHTTNGVIYIDDLLVEVDVIGC